MSNKELMVDKPGMSIRCVQNMRDYNEDSVYYSDSLCIVADGLGGHGNGDLASREAVAGFVAALTVPATSAGIEQAAKAAYERILEAGATCGNPILATTMCGVVRAETGVWAFNIGDSAVFRASEKGLGFVTVPHVGIFGTVARCLMLDYSYKMDTFPCDPGRFIICSDGCYPRNKFTAIELGAAERTPEEAADTIVREALALGSSDNISVIVWDME